MSGPPRSAPPPRRLARELALAEYAGADDRRRMEIAFRLLVEIAEDQENHDARLDRHGRRLFALEEAERKKGPRGSSWRPAPDLEATGQHELRTLRENQQWWRRLGVTFVVGVLSAIVIATILGVAKLLWMLSKGVSP